MNFYENFSKISQSLYFVMYQRQRNMCSMIIERNNIPFHYKVFPTPFIHLSPIYSDFYLIALCFNYAVSKCFVCSKLSQHPKASLRNALRNMYVIYWKHGEQLQYTFKWVKGLNYDIASKDQKKRKDS